MLWYETRAAGYVSVCCNPSCPLFFFLFVFFGAFEALKAVRADKTCTATSQQLSHLCFCLQTWGPCSLHRWMRVLFLIEERKASIFLKPRSELAALPTQQHFSLYIYIHIFTPDQIISTGYNNSVNHEAVLYTEPVVWWHAWERQMAAVQFPFNHQERKETYVWPLITWHGAADLVWGETKGVFWGDLSLGSELTSLQRSIVLLQRHKRLSGTRRPLPPPSLPSKSRMISKWSAARPPVDGIQSSVCVMVSLFYIKEELKMVVRPQRYEVQSKVKETPVPNSLFVLKGHSGNLVNYFLQLHSHRHQTSEKCWISGSRVQVGTKLFPYISVRRLHVFQIYFQSKKKNIFLTCCLVQKNKKWINKTPLYIEKNKSGEKYIELNWITENNNKNLG